MDEWVAIPDFPKYSVNRLGQVRHNGSERILRPKVNQYDVVYVGLVSSEDMEQYQRGLARIVASAFVEKPMETFDTPINLDGDRFNCHVDNLMWRPRWFAIRYHQQFKHRWPDPILESIRDAETGTVFPDSWSVAVRFGLLEKDVCLSMEHGTYVWPTYQRFELA